MSKEKDEKNEKIASMVKTILLTFISALLIVFVSISINPDATKQLMLDFNWNMLMQGVSVLMICGWFTLGVALVIDENSIGVTIWFIIVHVAYLIGVLCFWSYCAKFTIHIVNLMGFAAVMLSVLPGSGSGTKDDYF